MTPSPAHATRPLATKLTKALVATALLMATFIGGCGSLVGDDCETQTDCGQTMFCELSMEEGYCTRRNCELDGCPDEGVCITFEVGISYCMRECETNDDCRDKYSCVADFGVRPFCNDSRGISPGSAIASTEEFSAQN